MLNRIIGGRYELLEEIGNGGMAVVYKAYDKLLGRNVAVKLLRKEFNADNEFVQNFITEARAAASLSNQNLVGIYDVGNDELYDVYFIVMEYLKGITLKNYINRTGAIDWQEACSYALQILKGISAAHAKGIIHRDIKPQNIMIMQNGAVKIMDFGIARAISSKTVKIGGKDTLGSAHYLSPEQAKGRHTDEKSDIYSLGIVLYEMLTGNVPFDGDNPVTVAMMHLQDTPTAPSKINPGIPVPLDGIILKAIAKERDMRYNNADEMLADIKLALRSPDTFTPAIPGVYMEATQKIPTAGQEKLNKLFNDDEMEVSMRANRPASRLMPDEEDNSKSKKLNKWGLIAGCTFGVLCLFFLVYAFFPGLFSVTSLEIPDLVGKNIIAVQTEYKDNKDFSIIIESREKSTEYEKDLIISQDPTSGRSMKGPIEIKVVVSDGLKDMSLPDLIGKDEREAKQILQEMGIKFSITTKSSDSVDDGLVISTSPKAGATLTDGQTVKITVSQGIQEINAPNFIGLSLNEAKNLAKENNLELSYTYGAGAESAGTVISQNPGKNKKIKEFSTIVVVLSDGSKAGGTATPTPTPPVATPEI